MQKKTEKPTPKKRRDAREEGQVLQSREVTAAFILLASFFIFKILWEIFHKFFNEIYD